MSTTPSTPTKPQNAIDASILVDIPLRKKEVCRLTGLSHVTIWRLEKAGNFPQRFQLHGRIVAWRRSEVMRWIGEKMNPSEAA